MTDQLTTITIHGKRCHVYQQEHHPNGAKTAGCMPVFYWGVNRDSKDNIMTVVSYLKEHMPSARFLFTAYETENWNDDFSLWKAEAVFGKDAFGGKAVDTLRWLTEYCMPSVEREMSEIARFPVGYSLAGLFSLWVYCKCDLFAGAVSCSGSLWYEGWLDFMQEWAATVSKRQKNWNSCNQEMEYLYLSLGDKEEKTRQKRLSTVKDCTTKTYALLCGEQTYRKGILEWNRGGHFTNPDLRIAKGIHWILKQFDV